MEYYLNQIFVEIIMEYYVKWGLAVRVDTKQSQLESTTEITQNKHVKVLHYFVDDIKWLKWYL